MSRLAADAFDIGNIADNAEAAAAFGAHLDETHKAPGGAEEEDLTIAGGVVTPTGWAANIETQGGAATDDLDRADPANHEEGRLLILRCLDASHVVTVKHLATGSGEFKMIDGKDLVLDDPLEEVAFVLRGTVWCEVWRSHGNRLRKVLVVTGVLASPTALAFSDNNKTLINTGAAAEIYGTLPSAVAGMRFLVIVNVAQAFRLVANAGDTIRDGATVSAAAGYASIAGVIGNYFEVESIDGTQWFVTRKQGVLTVA